ncbi:MAG: Flp pilus assembly complex ATPase component TadA, partial [Candidatus Aenigmarchaeota archaeon]|nr:Flp pilus assembly complex ATPase component TadA [Candidatus Aenigmarchaeota archaeon]
MAKKSKIYVPDTSAIINGNVTELINAGKLTGELIIPEFVISELENQANSGKEIGFEGLEELKKIRDLCTKKKIKTSEFGRKPTIEEIRLAKSGRIDSLIKDIAKEHSATLITADIVQAKSAEAVGLGVVYFKKEDITKLKLEKYFTKNTMSVHLKEGCTPKAKRGTPGKFSLKEIGKELVTNEYLEELAHEVMEIVRVSDDAFLEMGFRGATVVQYKTYRIAITRPPFSEKMELTAVRPTMKTDLESYTMSDKLKQRLETRAEGVILAGPPGHGKSTLAQALAEAYKNQGKIVKTMEQPRDLQVGPEITQYGALSGDMDKTADLLLLVRPDFTIYDEVRKTKDFRLFSDMRLAGVGMIGVVHATEAIDAVHRFIGRIELGMIPQVIDTIIYIKDGQIKTVYTLKLTVRVPSGMTEQDLARPVVDVLDFETGELVYEMYT